jgi:lysophospholipid acyltransferase (LPLAT)-like uncharacterized protein
VKERIHALVAWLAMTIGHLLVLALGRTWRIRHVEGENVAATRTEGGPVLYAFSHGVLFPLAFTHRGRGIRVLISESRDGEIIARIVRRLGFGTVRGSSTRGGRRAVVGMAAAAREGHDLAITPDGPRGPRGAVEPGVVRIAARAGIPVIPVGVGTQRGWRARSWDRFLVPKPRARVWVAYGPSMRCEWTGEETEDRAELERIEAALRAVEERAVACAEGRAVPARWSRVAP